MTRINSSIHPSELPSKLLLAEHRECKRIPNCILKGRYSLKDAPSAFTLGKGHCKFYYSRLAYLSKRYDALFYECLNRGYMVTDYSEAFTEAIRLHPELAGDWEETEEARELIIERIQSKGFDLIETNK